MIDFDNRTPYNLDLTRIESIVRNLTDKEIELILTNNEEIHAINKEFRRIDAPTDVLSFPYEEMPSSPLGSIVISYDYVESASKKFNHSPDDEFALLFIHGLLHILGFDHESDNGEMRQKENEIIKEYGLPESLIVRTEG
ncbi:rRNA maturation RNase YbeY [Sulfurimonas sp. HSL-1716]|uniref:rRNA maturation RNase YbeY n=1 Tax=Hydrocurvibacter sulfurireducens TaxID=3131937 RepID=UPI0031F9C5A6